MTEDEIIDLGIYCEALLSEPRFATIVEEFEKASFQHFRTTLDPHKAEREFIFATMRGLQNFLSHMAAIVEQKNEITNERNPEPSTEDAPEEDFVN